MSRPARKTAMLEPEDLFHPRHYHRQRLPLPDARTLPAWCYTSETFHRREIERIFLRAWHFVGRGEELPAAGDYRCADLAGGPVVVVRDEAGELHAFANTCRHRGARLLAGAGRCERIVCPYHGWTYALNGALRGAPRMQRTRGFDLASWGLVRLRLATWQGFVFVSFDPGIETLERYYGDLFERFAPYRFDRMTLTRRREYRLACNWKLLLDNAHEAYHTGVVHSASIGEQHAEALDTRGNWEVLFHPLETSVAVLPGERTAFPHIAGLGDALAGGTNFTLLYPNTHFACVQDCMWWMTFIPTGAQSCLSQVGFCFPKTTCERTDFDEVVRKYYHRWDVSIDEDNATGELQQQGLRSALREPGPYSHTEAVVHRFANWVLDRVLDAPEGPPR